MDTGDAEKRSELTPAQEYLASNERMSRAARLATPGAIRSRAALPGIASALHLSSAQRGVFVSVGPELLLVDRETTRSLWAAGNDHEVFSLAGVDAVYAPAFSEMFSLLPRGRKGWSRKVSHGRVVGSADGVYVQDASTLRKLSPDGKDAWYASVPGTRQLEGLFSCDLGLVVQGSHGRSSEVVRVSDQGDVGRRLPLDLGAVLLGASRSCEPLVWNDGKILQLDVRGQTTWGRATPMMPMCSALPSGQACIAARGDDPALYELVDASGNTLAAAQLPIVGRLTSAIVAAGPSGLPRVIGACTDVTSPCAQRNSTRGPFNALLSIDTNGAITPLFKHQTGHVSFVALPDGRLVVASSVDGNSTTVSARDGSNAMLWQAELPGRLTAGPIADAATVYVATCRGLICEAPFELFGLTLESPSDDTETRVTTP